MTSLPGVVSRRRAKVEAKEARARAHTRRLTVTRVRGISIVIAESETTVKPPFIVGPSLTFHRPPIGSPGYTPDRPELTHCNPTTTGGVTQPLPPQRSKAERPNEPPISTFLLLNEASLALLPFKPRFRAYGYDTSFVRPSKSTVRIERNVARRDTNDTRR